MTPYTQLAEYTIWWDGTVVIPSHQIVKWIGTDNLAVDRVTPDIEAFNRLQPTTKRISTKAKLNRIDFDWTHVPSEYASMDLYQAIIDRFVDMSGGLTSREVKCRLDRIKHEYDLYMSHGLEDPLRCMVYIMDKFTDADQVWGVGRGSSVSSYILYVLGVHDVDSVEYNLSIDEFIKP